MANTTPADVLSSLATLIEGLDPAGGEIAVGGSRSSYSQVNATKWREDPEQMPGSGIDRRFVLRYRPGPVEVEGLSTTNVHRVELDIGIGHQVGQWDESRDRKDKDIAQLVTQLIREEHRPTGVWRIACLHHSEQLAHDATFWWTWITFEAVVAVSSDYGG
jgi:hypothetical protein